MRLIDADDLIKYIPLEEHGAIVAVKCCPTAYDVDSVIEELETNEEFYRDMDDDFYYEGMHHAFIDAIEIVRRGGVCEKE